MAALKVEHLNKTFISGCWPFTQVSSYTSVNNISFELQKGEILGFLGPNGAGKTTTIQMLLGTLTPTSGSIQYFGSDFATNRINSLKKIGYASGYDRFPGRLTIAENLDIVGRIYGMNQEERMYESEKLLKIFDMWHMRDRRVETLSAGQNTRVMLAKAFMNNPEIVLLDEPTASLDPDVAYEVRKFILEQRKKCGTSVLITSHNMDEVAELCDRVVVLKKGSIIANNSPELLIATISKVRVHLTIITEIDAAITCLKTCLFNYKVEGSHIIIEIDEQSIASLLMQLSEYKIVYSHISIDKPTLEDYFLTIAK